MTYNVRGSLKWMDDAFYRSKHPITANFPQNVPMKKNVKIGQYLAKIWQKFAAYFFAPPCTQSWRHCVCTEDDNDRNVASQAAGTEKRRDVPPCDDVTYLPLDDGKADLDDDVNSDLSEWSCWLLKLLDCPVTDDRISVE